MTETEHRRSATRDEHRRIFGTEEYAVTEGVAGDAAESPGGFDGSASPLTLMLKFHRDAGDRPFVRKDLRLMRLVREEVGRLMDGVLATAPVPNGPSPIALTGFVRRATRTR